MPKKYSHKQTRSLSKILSSGSKKPILVKWIDATDDAGDTWDTKEEIASRNGQQCIVESAGWFVGEDSDYVILAADKEDTKFSRRIKIPKVDILALLKV